MKRYARGWFRDAGQVPLYVSRGIGTSMAPVRFGSPPEVAVFTMRGVSGEVFARVDLDCECL